MERTMKSRSTGIHRPIGTALAVVLGLVGAGTAMAQPPRPTAEPIEIGRVTAERFATLADDQAVVIGGETTTAGELRAVARSTTDRIRRMARGVARGNGRHLDYRRRVLARDQEALRESTIAAAEAGLEELRARRSSGGRPRAGATDPDGDGPP